MTMPGERRVHPRARVKVRLAVNDPATGRPVILHTMDLSEGGARCEGLSRTVAGLSLEGFLYLPLSEGGRDVDVPIAFRGRVARAEGAPAPSCRRLSIQFTEMADGDRAELRRYLLDWLAADSLTHGLVGAAS